MRPSPARKALELLCRPAAILACVCGRQGPQLIGLVQAGVPPELLQGPVLCDGHAPTKMRSSKGLGGA